MCVCVCAWVGRIYFVVWGGVHIYFVWLHITYCGGGGIFYNLEVDQTKVQNVDISQVQ